MDTLPFFCDPRYVNANSASTSVNVDGLCPEQIVIDDVQQQQQMWLCGFANGDLPSFFAPPHVNDPAFGMSPHATCVGNQATIISPDFQHFQPCAPVLYNNLDAGNFFGAEQVYVDVNIGGPITTDSGLQFPMQDCDTMYDDGSIYANPVDCSPPPYTAYPEPNGAYMHAQMEIPDYSTPAVNVMQPATDEKQLKVFAQAANNTVIFVEGHVPRTVRQTRRIKQVKKSKKAARMAGEYDWVTCNVVAVKDDHDPDCPPTYRVTTRSLARVNVSGEPKAPTGQKRPRTKLVISDPDGKEKVLLFRAGVVRFSARCEWDGCQEVVWTDRKSIREHFESAHGVHWEPLNRVVCLWEGCGSDVLIDSLFRHITNSHMKVIRAPCVYGCGEDYARVDNQKRHSPKCALRHGSEEV